MKTVEYGTVIAFNRFLRRGKIQADNDGSIVSFRLGSHCHAEPVHRISNGPREYDGPRWCPDWREQYPSERKPAKGDRICFDRKNEKTVERWEYEDCLRWRIPLKARYG